MKKDTRELTIQQETVKECPLLYDMINGSCMETCMCWGWEFERGWDNIVSSASRQLETLNQMFYPKYRIRIQADQIKEKYGSLHFYYSIKRDSCKIKTSIYKIIDYFQRKLKNIDFKLQTITDQEPYDYDSKKYIEDYEENVTKASNVKYIIDGTGVCEITSLRNYGKRHIEPTKFKFLYWLNKKCLYYKNIFRYCNRSPTSQEKNAIEYLNCRAEQIIQDAEDKCSKTCELCGSTIGTQWFPACMTVGYIRLICEKCAKKSDFTYRIGDSKDEYYHGQIVTNGGK